MVGAFPKKRAGRTKKKKNLRVLLRDIKPLRLPPREGGEPLGARRRAEDGPRTGRSALTVGWTGLESGPRPG